VAHKLDEDELAGAVNRHYRYSLPSVVRTSAMSI
jgi:hypothetical protein